MLVCLLVVLVLCPAYTNTPHTHTHTHTHTQCSQCYEAHQRQWAWQVSAFCVHAWRQISRDTRASRLGLISAAFTASTTLPAGQATQAGHKLKVNMQSKLTIFTFYACSWSYLRIFYQKNNNLLRLFPFS